MTRPSISILRPGPALRRTMAILALLLLVSGPATASTDRSTDWDWPGYAWIRDLAEGKPRIRRRARERIEATGDPRFVAPLVDTLFFVPRSERRPLVKALEELTGVDLGLDYHPWVEWVGAREDLRLPPEYLGWKGSLFARIDSRFEKILYPRAPHRIRPEEVVWGGVPVGGIPALDHPSRLPADEADLDDEELVFGVHLGGRSLAYPRRVLSWHEMANDEIGDRPVTLSYCTLCGSALLFDAGTEEGDRRTFATSGLLYRSNKLMIDLETGALWLNLTGRPVLGHLAAEEGVSLPLLPLVTAPWGEWRARHPDTETLDLEALARRYPFDYQPGAADRAREGVSFPVWQRSRLLDPEAEIFALRLDGSAKAYPASRLDPRSVVNDRVGSTPVVLVVDRGSGIRAYRRGTQEFRLRESQLVDEAGRPWSVTEDALIPPEPAGDSGLEPLPRLPGHRAFWFGWYGIHPETEVWREGSS